MPWIFLFCLLPKNTFITLWLSWALWLSLWRTHRPRCEHFHVETVYFLPNNTRHPYRRINGGKRASGHGWETQTCDGEVCKHWCRRGEGSACFLSDKRSANLCAVIQKEKGFRHEPAVNKVCEWPRGSRRISKTQQNNLGEKTKSAGNRKCRYLWRGAELSLSHFHTHRFVFHILCCTAHNTSLHLSGAAVQ